MVKTLDFCEKSVRSIGMKSKKIYVRKSLVYNAVVGLGLLAPLMGDSLRPSAIKPPETVKAPLVQINPDDWQSLAAAVRRRALHFGGASGYIIKDLKSGEVVMANEDRVFPSASLIK